ncbi:MAG: MCE family protein [Armatimonadetes bacterium]|nr:MCE family protein [Armatimonadota bacterium]
MRTEAKIGFFVVIAVILFLGLFAFLGRGLLQEPGYRLDILFANGEGTAPGAPVTMAGVQIGTIRSISLTADNQVLVVARVRPGVEIPVGSRFLIGSTTLLGGRTVQIVPGTPIRGYYSAGARIRGEVPPTIGQLFERVALVADDLRDAIADARVVLNTTNRAVELVGRTIDSVNALASDERLRRSLLRSVQNVEAATARFDRIVSWTGAPVHETAENFRVMSRDLAALAAQLQRFGDSVVGDGEVSRQIRTTVTSIESTARRIDEMTRTLQAGLINEKQMGEVRGLIADTRKTVQQAGETLKQADTAIDQVAGVVRHTTTAIPMLPSLRFTYELWWDSASALRHDIDVWGARGQPRYYRFGIHDLGRGNLLQVQAGFRLDDALGWRLGIVDSQVGIGLDYQLAPRWTTILDLYNFNRLTLNFASFYEFQQGFSLSLHVRNILIAPSVGVGLQYRY